MARGDHFFVWRFYRCVPFQHHGIDLGDGEAIHFTNGAGEIAGPMGNVADFVIQKTSMDEVTQGGRYPLHFVKHSKRLSAEETVARGESQLGRGRYHLVFDNCEHFAHWCAVGQHESRQVAVVYERASSAAVKAVAIGAVSAVAKHGLKRSVRGLNPWMLVGDAIQWATEAGGHHVGLGDPVLKRRVGRTVGALGVVGTAITAGPVAVLAAGGVWIAGEVAGEVTRLGYEVVRRQRSAEEFS